MPEVYYKLCTSARAFVNETRIYDKNLDCTPKLISALPPREIILQKVDGCPYMGHPSGWNPALLGQTIAHYHSSFYDGQKTLCHHDNQPGNILYTGERYYLIDFSETLWEYPEHDISHLHLFWAAEMPLDALCQAVTQFMDSYSDIMPLSTNRLLHFQSQNIKRFDLRRLIHRKKIRHSPNPEDSNRAAIREIYAEEF